MSPSSHPFRNSGVKGPCKGCDKRRPACHDSCPLYAEYRARVDAAREREHQYSQLNWSTAPCVRWKDKKER